MIGLRLALPASLIPLLFSSALDGRAQQPFDPDAADATPCGKLRLQVGDEYDLPQRALYPAKTRNVVAADLDYGFRKNVEIGIAKESESTPVQFAPPRFSSGPMRVRF